MRKRFLAPLAALGACAGVGLHPAVPGDRLVFEGRVDGAPLGLPEVALARLRRVEIRGRDPATGRGATFGGVPLAPLIAEELPLRRGADLVVFHGAGGRRGAVPLSAVRQMQPVLADRVDGRPVEEGGSLLAWPVAEAPGLESDPRLRWWWLRAVTRVELLSWIETDGKALRLPAGSGDEARRGADGFAGACMGCHRLRGQGGTAGPELGGTPAAAGPERLAAFLGSHLASRPETPRAPEPAPGLLRQVAAFLEAVSRAGAPEEEIAEPEAVPAPKAPPRPPAP